MLAVIEELWNLVEKSERACGVAEKILGGQKKTLLGRGEVKLLGSFTGDQAEGKHETGGQDGKRRA